MLIANNELARINKRKCNVRNKSITYVDIPDRLWAINSPIAQKLFAAMPDEISAKMKSCFMSDCITDEDRYFMVNYLTTHSAISRIINSEPSSAEAFEYLYKEKEIHSEIDDYFLKCLAGLHVEKRLDALEVNLLKYISRYFKADNILIDNICSGPGHDLIRVLKNNPWVATKLQVRNIDTNQHALDIGRQKVDALGIGKSFQFICNDFAKVKSCDADVIILVGVLCTMPMDISIKILKTLKRYCRKGGMIIYSTNQLAMIEADPLADFFMRLAGWTMDYKTDEESIMIGELAGWKYKDQFFDDGMHFQCMTVCNK